MKGREEPDDTITVRELLQLPHLRMTLIAGEVGLDREISWVHTSDLPDPRKWHGPAELLLTNGTNLSADEPAQVQFIERLAETGQQRPGHRGRPRAGCGAGGTVGARRGGGKGQDPGPVR